MPSTAGGNRAICTRFQEEGLDVVEFYESDVSDGELEDAIGDLTAVNELASQPQKQRTKGLLPIHTIFVLDSSASMGNRDVDGKQRSAAVFDVCGLHAADAGGDLQPSRRLLHAHLL
mmetsp:Transcript_8668/g.20386  ORF Transcript_8668/g.20386 Transcript_8668/m.20386 type:complete len:117 (-) Transcript_8668:158-508(-)